MSKVIESCYQCPHFEDRRYYWCDKLKKEISGVAVEFPSDCPLPKAKTTTIVHSEGRYIEESEKSETKK